jgi:TolB-like protein/cytochrome c-type biogenesis protein CcmH/NrfG
MELADLPCTDHPTEAEIRQQLDRIFASAEFHSPQRGRAFLQFIVDETLAGRSEFLKAFTIANIVFGRNVSFDAQNDPVVRIEAGRMRRALERYYLIVGRDDRVVVTIPKGGYVPSFTYAESGKVTGAITPFAVSPATEHDPVVGPSSPAPFGGRPNRPWIRYALPVGAVLIAIAALVHAPLASVFAAITGPPDRPTVADSTFPKILVEQFQSNAGAAGTGDIAQGLRDEVIGQLAKFKDIVVIANPATADESSTEEPRYALQGSVRLEDSQIRSLVRLIRTADGAVVWANSYDGDMRSQGLFQIQEDIAQRVAGTVAQPYGTIFQTDADGLAKEGASGGFDGYACTLAYYSYRMSMNGASHDAAKDCLQRATQHNPNDATHWALLSLTNLDEFRFASKLHRPSSPAPLQRAVQAAQKAISIDPQNPRALQALMLVSFFQNDIDTALRAGAAAYAANPNDAEVAGEYGLRLSMSGKWQSGCELVSSAVNKSAGPKGYYEVGMALCAFMRGDLQAAELWSRMSDLEYNPMHRLVLLSILGAAGKREEGKQQQDWLQSNAPALMKNIRKEVSIRLQRAEDQERFFAGLRAAGTPVASSDTPVSTQ